MSPCIVYEIVRWREADAIRSRHEATAQIWQEVYLSAMLRAILYADDANYVSLGRTRVSEHPADRLECSDWPASASWIRSPPSTLSSALSPQPKLPSSRVCSLPPDARWDSAADKDWNEQGGN